MQRSYQRFLDKQKRMEIHLHTLSNHKCDPKPLR